VADLVTVNNSSFFYIIKTEDDVSAHNKYTCNQSIHVVIRFYESSYEIRTLQIRERHRFATFPHIYQMHDAALTVLSSLSRLVRDRNCDGNLVCVKSSKSKKRKLFVSIRHYARFMRIVRPWYSQETIRRQKKSVLLFYLI